MKKHSFILLLLLLIMSCGGSSDEPLPNESAATLIEIAIVFDAQEIPLGTSLQLMARGTYDNGISEIIEDVQWSSNDNSIATIISSGNVSSLALGVVEVTVQAGNLSNSIDLTVTSASLLSVNVQITDDDIVEGTTTQAQAFGTYSDNRTIIIDVVWQTSDATIATIGEAGNIIGVSAGQVEISGVSGTVTSAAGIMTIFDTKLISIDVVGDYRNHTISYAQIYNRYIELNNTYNLVNLQIESVSNTGNASEVALNSGNNQLIYTPMSGYWGGDSFTITLWNGSFQDEIDVVINIQRDFQLSVSGSTHATARYLPSTDVSISADQAPDGQSFEFWQAVDSAQPVAELIDDAANVTAILTMPAFDLSINAIYQPNGITDIESPTAPSNFGAETIGNTTVVLAWEASTDNVAVLNYQITELGADRTLITESTSITITNLNPNSMYTFQIIAIDAAGNRSSLVFSEQLTTTNNMQELRIYHFGHSLMLHQRSNNPIYDSNSSGSRDDKELSILYWMKQLTDVNGSSYFADGQYHNQPQVGYTIPITTNTHWPWRESETTVWDSNFVNTGYNAVLYTDLNFVQGNGVDEPYNTSPLTPIQKFERVITYDELEPDTPIYLYAGWADGHPTLRDAGYADGISPPTLAPTSAQVRAYYEYAIGTDGNISSYEQWWRDLYQQTRSMGNVTYMPVNWILIRTLRDSGYMANAEFGDLFEDKAPHGRASIYLMAGMIQYVVMNNAVPAAPQSLPTEVIHQDVINNFDAIASFMLTEWQSVKADLSIE